MGYLSAGVRHLPYSEVVVAQSPCNASGPHDIVSMGALASARHSRRLFRKNILFLFLCYDIRGKRHLSFGDKYYLADHAFRCAKLGTRNRDFSRMLENMTAIELLRRGHETYTYEGIEVHDLARED